MFMPHACRALCPIPAQPPPRIISIPCMLESTTIVITNPRHQPPNVHFGDPSIAACDAHPAAGVGAGLPPTQTGGICQAGLEVQQSRAVRLQTSQGPGSDEPAQGEHDTCGESARHCVIGARRLGTGRAVTERATALRKHESSCRRLETRENCCREEARTGRGQRCGIEGLTVSSCPDDHASSLVRSARQCASMMSSRLVVRV